MSGMAAIRARGTDLLLVRRSVHNCATKAYLFHRYSCPALHAVATNVQLAMRNHPHTGGQVQAVTCGEAVMNLLAAYEVDTVFGMAGTMTLEVYTVLGRAGTKPLELFAATPPPGPRNVQCRNEQGASLMADGYARATGKP